MPIISALVACLLLGALSVFQIALAAGAPLGRFAWGGQHRVLPARLRVGSAIAVVIYVVVALIALDRSGLTAILPPAVSTVGIWICFGYFALGIPMNVISRSKPERWTMTPVTLVLSAACLVLALGPAVHA